MPATIQVPRSHMWSTAPLLDGTDMQQASAMEGSSGHTIETICPPKSGTLGLEQSRSHRRCFRDTFECIFIVAWWLGW